MHERTLADNLAYCKPFAAKLAAQGYDYIFDRADLAYIALIEPIYDYFFATDEVIKETSLLADNGLSEQEFRWLIVFYEMRESLQKQRQSPEDVPYTPFKERLDFLVESEDVNTLNTRNGFPDPEHLVLVTLARSDPFYLSITEKRLTINLTYKPGQPSPSLFTPRDRRTLKEFRRRVEQEGINALLPANFFPPDSFHKKR
ncbi:hypothetical protein [Ktedonobacter robiniae]|uniref:Uncharacterized protein n=1 Tax=Ktedonobacter robiniae TaxID=2778365 RepID=A0ABQ3UM86_9CHLR|nr:hypothetical protein [Ktedonobacter robiniae]GHO53732.1 hypothetical protein KSB_22070 [Ktedonobacter robiniae]